MNDESFFNLNRSRLLNYILEGEQSRALEHLNTLSESMGHNAVMDKILSPVLVNIGNLWHQEQISLAAGYLAGKITETFLLTLKPEEKPSQSAGTAVIGNIEDDYHSLGRKLVGTFLNYAGWKVIDLGNDVLPVTFIDAALENKAHVIGVSAMMLTTARNIIEVRRELDRRGFEGKIPLAVGGAVFKVRPDLVSELGGDGTADNAIDAPALFVKLKNSFSGVSGLPRDGVTQ
ncbi:cobalamin-dependent protein [Myxococcota bacterium]|nr:cobalamin-dependent protein [Myxococcota bacterium]MBU1382247.1 cobalamin-dependent protein [Myxococcota bacterium]MBU1496644.1 cobalamin-dependent protein [Myxococcota bacterium]